MRACTFAYQLFLHSRWFALTDEGDFESILAEGPAEITIRHVCPRSVCGVCIVHCDDTEVQAQELSAMLAASSKYSVRVLPNDGQWLRESLLGPAAKPRVKILHFADHGSASLGIRMAGQDALGPRSLTKQDLVQSLARCHARLDCIVLDMCHSSTYAEAIMLEPRSARYVIHWDTAELGSQVSKARP